MVSTMTTSAGAGGEATRQGIELAVEKLGGRVGGIPVRMFYEDDALQPELGKQKTEKLILEDKVDFLVGYNYSNIVLAALKPAIDSKTFLLSITGPSQLAGRQYDHFTVIAEFGHVGQPLHDWLLACRNAPGARTPEAHH
uniref:ABC transporter substrate-binding protein n=2 Tax=Comamonas TaxID=283 RepID=A0A1V0J9R6_COMTE|nr:ABC transporter substrate-binding protein [Comamonas testosteroni]